MTQAEKDTKVADLEKQIADAEAALVELKDQLEDANEIVVE